MTGWPRGRVIRGGIGTSVISAVARCGVIGAVVTAVGLRSGIAGVASIFRRRCWRVGRIVVSSSTGGGDRGTRQRLTRRRIDSGETGMGREADLLGLRDTFL